MFGQNDFCVWHKNEFGFKMEKQKKKQNIQC